MYNNAIKSIKCFFATQSIKNEISPGFNIENRLGLSSNKFAAFYSPIFIFYFIGHIPTDATLSSIMEMVFIEIFPFHWQYKWFRLITEKKNIQFSHSSKSQMVF